MSTLLLLHGPNLNLLGTREPEIYGSESLENINTRLRDTATASGHELLSFQSNHEGALVDRIQQAAGEGVSHILINPAAYTHTSVAIRDALLAVAIPFTEIHLSNPHSREEFRHHSFLSDIAQGVVVGFGPQSYDVALNGILSTLA
ncbi:type II 3-dehydroquinate dehydratase [Umboniibacter marinipuniceus]|uniref:3-dehydroquinate dehydratase n=1 Tax=Umboniibacter marinipuniceus TaxID=569599 RepID=A0A3M0A4L4_9GAMM|nr:type II 3-dehydroquinate dehydratase [Umboniibacter marinipuniceus]RMA80111.1 3-dehydroquinate dehydratase [Umboniibacter marinipuniceus]